MMDRIYRNAFILGYERMAAWSDLLDQINVFPVADADTGRNLKISLAPLRQLDQNPKVVPQNLLRAATGNSGNIAAAFFYELLGVQRAEALATAIRAGVHKAQKAVIDPKPGTMLTVFEALHRVTPAEDRAFTFWDFAGIIGHLEKTVAGTVDALPELKQAGVVDAGALGMFIFLEAFLNGLGERTEYRRPLTEAFRGKLQISSRYKPVNDDHGYCVSATLQTKGANEETLRCLAAYGESIVVTEEIDCLKVHLHTGRRQALKSGLEGIGRVVDWSEEKIDTTGIEADRADQAVHIMTDAAGSVTTADARDLGILLLNSYLVVDEQAWPETLYAPERLYAAMADGKRVTTAQASVFERHQSYLSAISRFQRVLYLCVGSVYTGNYAAATAWKIENDPHNRLTVLDSGAASGRLGIAALATARFARRCENVETVLQFAQAALKQAQELVFLDQLKFLAAGGRISKTKGFFGDLLHMKPIITPTPRGVEKVGVARHRSDQLAFGLEWLRKNLKKEGVSFIVLQYSNNRQWVEEVVAEPIRSMLPEAEIIFRPLSLTSGAHMGPGTWAVASLPGSASPETKLGSRKRES